MIVQKVVRDLIREIAKEYNVSYDVAQGIIWSEFKFVKENIGNGVKGEYDTFNHVFLRFLGTFKPSKKKIYYMSERFNKKEYEK